MRTHTVSARKRRLIDDLKRRGPCAAGDVAAALQLTTVAVRQHLQALEVDGLVRQVRQAPGGRGRPAVLWSLTDRAFELFPDGHAELTADLIDAARKAFGVDAFEAMLDVRAREQVAAYRRGMPPAGRSLKRRVEALARLRSREGYMAEVVSEGPDVCFLVEHHCPICTVANVCRGLCIAEQAVFEAVLGDDVCVERVQHLLAGDDRCVYRVWKR